MAEIAVNLVIGKLIPLLKYEMTLEKGVQSEVAFIKDQLGLIRAYLRDADVKAETEDKSNVVKEWVKQVRDVAHLIEDVIDEYLLQVAERRRKRGLAGVVEKIAGLLRRMERRHGIISEISGIRKTIDNLDKKKKNLGFNPTGAESSTGHGEGATSTGHDLRRGALFLAEAQLVGINDTRKKLKNLLRDEDSRRIVIAVVGTGGLGKTTITKKLYDKEKEKRFDCSAWVPVSNSFKEKKIYKTMLRSFYDQEEEENEYKLDAIKKREIDSLMKEVREYLQEKSYIIVFDDVWAEDFWGLVEHALPENNKGSRVLITTRHKGVAEFCMRSAQVHIHEMQSLRSSDALELFHLKAFQFKPEGCPPELAKLSEDIVNKCDGVPLAIEAVASLLATKNNLSEWQKVHDNLGSKLASDPHLKTFHRALSESYHDLPSDLKPCLLYFGLFPDGYSISCSRLIRLWVAEGFVNVKENENRTMEEIAEEYLDELIRRSLVTVSSKYFDGKARSCRVHDLMLDFIKAKCAEQDFCQLIIKSENLSFNSTTRRLSIQFQVSSQDATAALKRAEAYLGRVRFCFAFNFEEMPGPLVKSIFSGFKLLEGLDFEDAPLDYLPEAVGNLLKLKYLNLRNTKIKTLPRFIGKLQNLETLDLKHTQVRELPIEINRLKKLRHLLAYSNRADVNFSSASIQGVLIKEGIGRLSALLKLLRVDMTDGDSLIKELKNLKQLRRLGIIKLRRHNGNLLCSAIEGMACLESLSIGAAEEHEILDLHSLVNAPQHLQLLDLYGRLETVPHWIPKLNVLVKLCFTWSGLVEDPLPVLKDLPELLELGLYDAFEGVELHFGDGWFKKLKALSLEKMQAAKTLKIDTGALPFLEKLTIGPCPQMVEIPQDIQNLQSLQLLRFYDMPMDPKEVEVCGILQNIPFVLYSKGSKFYTLHNDKRTETDDF